MVVIVGSTISHIEGVDGLAQLGQSSSKETLIPLEERNWIVDELLEICWAGKSKE